VSGETICPFARQNSHKRTHYENTQNVPHKNDWVTIKTIQQPDGFLPSEAKGCGSDPRQPHHHHNDLRGILVTHATVQHAPLELFIRSGCDR
jgi:hypothetical protein